MSWFLTFSDSAKFAQSAVRLLADQGFNVTHSFFNPANFNLISFKPEFSPLIPLLMATPLKLLGISDFSLIISGLLLLAFTLYCLFYAGFRLSGKWTGIVAAIIFLIIPGIWDYYWNFTSEAVAMFFLSLSLALYTKNQKKLTLLNYLTVILAIFARFQLICLPLAYLISRRKYLLSGIAVIIIGIFGFTYRQAFVALNFASGVPQGQYLRGREVVPLSIPKIISKTFYNVYNFAKSPERILPLGILVIGILGLNQLSLFSVTSLILLIFMASLTLPNARYVHPILPFFAVIFAVNLPKKLWSSLIIILLLIPIIGKYTLDQRHQDQHNSPINLQIADQMSKNLPKGELIITNLDAWAAWYHGLTTMWFPLEPDMLRANPPKYIVITNYLENDADFGLGSWKEVVYTPQDIQNEFLHSNYTVLTTFKINPDQIYEKQTYFGTILVRKQ